METQESKREEGEGLPGSIWGQKYLRNEGEVDNKIKGEGEGR